jgi:hypothetical protein
MNEDGGALVDADQGDHRIEVVFAMAHQHVLKIWPLITLMPLIYADRAQKN